MLCRPGRSALDASFPQAALGSSYLSQILRSLQKRRDRIIADGRAVVVTEKPCLVLCNLNDPAVPLGDGEERMDDPVKLHTVL